LQKDLFPKFAKEGKLIGYPLAEIGLMFIARKMWKK
jgi:hypothetical protein